MRVNYKKPIQIKNASNSLINKDFTLTLSFKVGYNFQKDEKIGFIGIPGRNFGFSYDYEVNKFVFEYWTKIKNKEYKFHCHKDFNINNADLNSGLTITLTYDSQRSTFSLYHNYQIIDIIKVKNKLIDEYYDKPIYFGCHNPASIKEKHSHFCEMEVDYFSIFDGVQDINEVKRFHTSKSNLTPVYYYDSVKQNEVSFFDDVDLTTFEKSVDFEEVKQKLDKVGCGFCLAKWTQVTMHLHNGTTHSCHHPSPHKVPLEELKRNHTALHNSNVKKYARKEMLNGERPSECNYCWNVEDNSNSFSDRVFKSSEPWSQPHFDEIKDLDWRANFNPKYVEVNFSNTCNFKCAYCGPDYSTKWVEEINKFGGYNLSFNYNSIENWDLNKVRPYKQTEQNPYVENFWKWWPELYQSMDTFRITGGEPLLSKDTWDVLDSIIENPNPNRNLKLSINSNLGVTDDLVDKLILKLDKIISEDRVKEVIIFTSCDAYGKQAEYVRYGLEFDKLFSNIDKILTVLDRVTIVVMSTFNIFSIFSYEKLIKKVHEMKLKHFNKRRYWNSALILDTSYLRYPQFLSFRILKGFLDVEYFNRCEKYVKFNSTYRSLNSFESQTIDDVGFSHKEIEKITRIKDLFVSDSEDDNIQFYNEKVDFVKFIRQYEFRRDLVCLEYFPELTEFVKKIEHENNL